MDVGRRRAISRSVVSWKMTYGGTPRARAICEPQRAQALEEIAIDVLPRLRLRPATSSAARPSRGGRCRASVRSGQLCSFRSSATPCARQHAAPDTRRRSAAAGRSRTAARCSRASRRPTRPAAGRRCSACRVRARRTCSVACPRSTLATCAAPKRWPTRATHDRILRASVTGSAAGSSSSRQ